MGTDKLDAINAVEEILRDPAAPPTYFDEDPVGEAAVAGGKDVKDLDDPRSRIEIRKHRFGEAGSLSKETLEARAVRDTKSESVSTVRQALAEETLAASPADSGRQKFVRPSHEIATSGLDTNPTSTLHPVVSDDGISPSRWILRAFAGILLVAGVGGVAAAWFGSSRDAVKTSPQLTAASLTVPTTFPPELTPLLQSMSRDLANLEKEIEQLKLAREEIAKDYANVGEQLKANREQLTGVVARLSDQLKASQDQAARDNANAAEQIRAIKDQLIQLQQTAPPKTVSRPPRIATPASAKPASTPSSAQAAAQPAIAKPRPPATATSGSPTSAPTPAR